MYRDENRKHTSDHLSRSQHTVPGRVSELLPQLPGNIHRVWPSWALALFPILERKELCFAFCPFCPFCCSLCSLSLFFALSCISNLRRTGRGDSTLVVIAHWMISSGSTPTSEESTGGGCACFRRFPHLCRLLASFMTAMEHSWPNFLAPVPSTGHLAAQSDVHDVRGICGSVNSLA